MPTYYKRDNTGTANWNLATSWSTVSSTSATNTGTFPSSTTLDPVIFDANSSVATVNVASSCTSITFAGYANTITFTNTLTVAGNVTLSNTATYAGPNGITINAATSTITFGGATYNLPLTITRAFNTGASTITFADSGQVSNYTITNGGGNTTITLLGASQTLSISGNASLTGASSGSTLSLLLNGSGTVGGFSGCNLTINTSGTYTLISALYVVANSTELSKNLIYQNGTINWAGFSLGVHSLSNRVINVNFPYPIFEFRIDGLFNNNGTITLLADLNVTNLLIANWQTQSSGPMTINGFNIYINGNLTNTQTFISGTTKLWMIGTGTINHTAGLNNSLEINSPSGTITIQRLAFFNGTFTFTYTTAATFTQTGLISFTASTCTFNNPGNANFTNFDFGVATNNNNCIINFNHNVNCTGISFSQVGGLAIALNGNTITVSGNITRINSPSVSGTSTIRFSGGVGTATWAGLAYGCNFLIEKNVSFTENMSFTTSGRSVIVTTGLINPGSSTVTISNNVSITINGMTFWNLTMGTSTTLIQNILNTIQSNLVCNGSATFAGTAGWTTSGFSCTTAGSTLTFQNATANPSASYVITGALIITGTAAARIILQAAGSASFTGIANGTALTYSSGTIPTSGMTISQATGIAPTGFLNLLPNRPTITGGTSPNFTISPSVSPTTGSIAMRAGYKAIFTLANNGIATQNVAYAQTQDIDSNAGQTILSFGSNGDDTATNTALFRTLNWGPLIAPSGSVYYTFVS
jgi:hypothetical protein